MAFDLNRHIHRLLQQEPFFAALSRRIDKRATSAFPTAGVTVNENTQSYELLYNPEFFEGLTDEERADVLKHEFYHLVFLHVTSRRPDATNPKTWNVATDLAINSHLKNLPKGCLEPGAGLFSDWESGLSSEAYLKMLTDNPDKMEELEKQMGDGGEMSPQFDSHEGWDEANSTAKEIAKERLKEFVKKAAKEANQKGWGSVSSDCRKEIMDKIVAKIDWRKVLRYFVKTSQNANKRSSIKKINKRYPYVHPGRKTSRTAKIAISIDQSGSVSDGMLAAFFSELNKLADIAEFTVIPFDDTVATDSIYVWKKGESRKWQRVRYGGTNFDAPTEYVNQHNFDGHIVLTDMCAPKPKRSKCQRMWMTTEYHASHPYFKTSERVIAITD
mgnify:CR=1 FL=1